MNEAVKRRMTTQQKEFLTAYKKCAGNVSATCEKCKIGRTSFYNWYNGIAKFKEAIDNEKEGQIDFAETKLQQNIMDGKEASIFFYLKTQGKSRGYVESIQADVSVNPFLEMMKAASAD